MTQRACSRRSVLAALLVAGGRAGASGFDDPLGLPAPAVRRVAQAQLTAVAHAGERLVAVGARGLVIVSDDAGRGWQQVGVPLSADLTAVHFTGPADGWIAGHDGVLLQSRDRGASWRKRLDGNAIETLLRSHFTALAADGDSQAAGLLKQLGVDHANGPEQPLLDVAFDGAAGPAGRGFACGAFGLLLGTEDGGASWQSWIERIDNPKGLHLNALCCVDGAWFIASEQGTVFRLADGEARFVPLETGYGGSYFGLVGEANRIVAFGLRGRACASADAGCTWRVLPTGVNTSLTAGARLADGGIVLATQAGQLIVGRDDGFAPVIALASMPLAGVVQAGDVLVVVGLGGVQRVPLR